MRNHKVPGNYETKDVEVGIKGKRRILGVYMMTVGVVFAVGGLLDMFMPFAEGLTGMDRGLWCLWMVVGFIPVIIGHEFLHYVAFKVCGTNPYFTLRKVKGFGWCPAVGIRNSVCSRMEYFFACLLPQVASVILIMVGIWMPPYTGRLLIFMAMMNFVGGVGDYQILYHIFKAPRCALFGDTGSGVRIYVPSMALGSKE